MCSSDLVAPAMAPLPQLTPGTVFARDFRVLRPLAAGGMGAVYVVEQMSTQRPRALKIMLPELVREPKARERFMQEATVSARIRSDHVVEVVGAGIDDATGTPWIAMELLEGEELADTLRRRGTLPPGEVMEVFRQLGHALGAAVLLGVSTPLVRLLLREVSPWILAGALYRCLGPHPREARPPPALPRAAAPAEREEIGRAHV